jgi:hypothetical protein
MLYEVIQDDFNVSTKLTEVLTWCIDNRVVLLLTSNSITLSITTLIKLH